jgi:2-iminobutanoate/2-iminopropanoate deaminase
MSDSSRTIIHTDNAPKAVGPYSQAVRVGDFVFTAGQVAIDPATNKFIGGSIEQQTKQVLTNLRGVLEAAGSSLEQVVKTTVFLTSIDNYRAMNGIYAEFFTKEAPARSAVAVAELPLGALVEIECVAKVKE